MTHAEIIQKNYDVLLRCTTINYYVIDFLKGENVLDRMQEAELKATKNSLKQRILLFQWLQELSSEKYESFLQVMNDTEQEHVTNLLRGRNEEGCLPLSNTRHDRLEKIRHKIAHVICTESELIAELRSSKAISKIDADEVRAENGEYVKSSKLISAIMRRSNQCYTSFQELLRKTLQKTAAEFLNEGEMPAVHLNNNRPDLDESLSFTFNETIRNNSENDTRVKELITELNGYGLHLVKAIPGQSIVIFIYCKTVQSAVKFTQLFNSGIMQYLLDSIFNRLLLTIEPRNSEELNSIISLEDEEIATLEEFTGLEGWKTQRLGRLQFFRKKSERDATTQADDNVTKREITADCKNQKLIIPPREEYRQAQNLSEFPVKCLQTIFLKTSALQKGQREAQHQILASVCTKWRNIVAVMNCEYRDARLFRAKDHDIFQFKRKFEETQSEKDEVTIQLQQKRQRVSIARKQDDFYVKSKFDEMLKGKARQLNLLKHNTKRGKYPKKYKSDPILIETIRIETYEQKFKSINGLTILDKELFVVCEESSEVEVYDSNKFSFSRRWNLSELNRPKDIGSCNTTKWLYILDSKGNAQSQEILKVDAMGQLQKNWSTGENRLDWLSITKESNVILAVLIGAKLKEYSPDGLLIREINLSSFPGKPIRHPTHAIQMTNGHFLISHEDADRHSTVSTVDAAGKLQKSLHRKCKSIIGEMFRPVYLSVDGNGFVLVADYYNGRVLLLDSNLEFERTILSRGRDDIFRPVRILQDESNGRLFVVDHQKILIFQFKNIAQ